MEVRVGDRVRFFYKNQNLRGIVEELMYVGSMTARVVTESGNRMNVRTSDLKVIKEKA